MPAKNYLVCIFGMHTNVQHILINMAHLNSKSCRCRADCRLLRACSGCWSGLHWKITPRHSSVATNDGKQRGRARPHFN